MNVLVQNWLTENGGALYQQSLALNREHNQRVIAAWQTDHPSDVPIGDPVPYEVPDGSPLALRLARCDICFMTPPR